MFFMQLQNAIFSFHLVVLLISIFFLKYNGWSIHSSSQPLTFLFTLSSPTTISTTAFMSSHNYRPHFRMGALITPPAPNQTTPSMNLQIGIYRQLMFLLAQTTPSDSFSMRQTRWYHCQLHKWILYIHLFLIDWTWKLSSINIQPSSMYRLLISKRVIGRRYLELLLLILRALMLECLASLLLIFHMSEPNMHSVMWDTLRR